jgi:hypothetical protein
MPSCTLTIKKEDKKHQKLLDRIQSRFKLAERGQQTRHDKWTRAEEITLAYIPESEADAARKSARSVSGIQTYTTIQIPYSYALLMSSHTYWTSVFFARNPIHQYSGRHGEGEMQIQALEALIGYQVEVGMMTGPYYIWLYDAGKYGVGILGQYWDVEKIHYGQIVEIPDPGAPEKFILAQMTQEVDGYRGNRVYNVAPYDFFPDPRFPVGRFQEGEFCFVRKRMGWSAILRRADQGYFMNVDYLKEHAKDHATDKSKSQGSDLLERPDFGNMLIYDNEREHPAGMTFLEMYVELVPDEWSLGSSRFPQKWCFTVTEDMGLIVGASPLGYIHGKFPFDVLEPEVEAYGLYNRGLPEIMEPIQQTMDWLVNSHFYNVRAALNNQFIVDPSKLVIKDAKNAGPGFIWRLRPEAYGTDIRSMFHQVQVNDVTRSHMADFQAMLGIGEKTLGVNDQIMGALSGGRKTATEIRTSTGFGVNRLKTVSEYMSATGFAPHSQKLVQSSQQYYDAEAKLKRVGTLAEFAGPNFLDVTPDMISGFFDFVPIDGTMPVDRMAQANLWKEIFANLQRMPPQIMQEYDIGKMFGWMAQLSGLKNIQQFKIQVVPDASIPPQVAAGNVIPMGLPKPGPGGVAGVAPGNSASTAAGLNGYGVQQ